MGPTPPTGERTSFLARIEDGASFPSCTEFVDASFRASAVAVSSTFDGPPWSAIQEYGGLLLGGPVSFEPPAVELACADDCAGRPELILRLQAVRAGLDAEFEWRPDSAAAGYNLWHVAERRDIDRARAASAPPAVGVPACSEPTPAGTARCRHGGATPLAPALFYYQVRAPCGAAAKGP